MLQIPLTKSNTIEGAILDILKAEELTGDNQYDAEQHGKQDAKKFLRIKKLPPVLQISLNRFGLTSEGIPKKINSRCEFKSTLDLSTIIKSSQSYSLSQSQPSLLSEEEDLYHLHAIMVHSGTINSGHYYCFIRPSVSSETWFKFNDTQVSSVTQQVAFSVGMGGYNSVFELDEDHQFYEHQ